MHPTLTGAERAVSTGDNVLEVSHVRLDRPLRVAAPGLDPSILSGAYLSCCSVLI
jgi:hypothetical protein